MPSPLPENLLQRLEGVAGFDRDTFVNVHQNGERVTSVRINPAKAVDSPESIVGSQQSGAGRPEQLAQLTTDNSPLTTHNSPLTQVPWSSYGYYLPERPFFTFDPLLHAGVYYVQEASSMFLEQALKQTVNVSERLRVLDLCAAPGGKSTLLQSLINADSLLVSNEVIKSRAAILEENLTKWGAANVVVTNNDPKDFERLDNFFDVVVIDAPCSGSGLFRREPEAIQEWSEQNVQLCCQRQQRIIADVYPSLQQNGILIYSTCSYSKEENEMVLDWLMSMFDVESLPLQTDASWGIVEVRSDQHQAYGYRFFPDKVKGEGLFMACFRKHDGGQANLRPPKKSLLQKISKQETAIIQPWLKAGASVQCWKQGDRVMAFPMTLEQELLAIVDKMYVRKAGVTVGKMAGNELVPDHALAVSLLVNPGIVAVSLKKEEVLQYLRREEVPMATSGRGWALVRYEGVNVGWIKILPNRVNNYYPKEWRILKSANN
jgi:16S rRNA C967 or C1407 C5-methylase (RsmB/RsmF family)/NOL1/NOP2/fmu family ribosome biogenesis protein